MIIRTRNKHHYLMLYDILTLWTKRLLLIFKLWSENSAVVLFWWERCCFRGMCSKQYILYVIEPYGYEVLMVSWVILSHSLVIVLAVFCIRFDTCSCTSKVVTYHLWWLFLLGPELWISRAVWSALRLFEGKFRHELLYVFVINILVAWHQVASQAGVLLARHAIPSIGSLSRNAWHTP